MVPELQFTTSKDESSTLRWLAYVDSRLMENIIIICYVNAKLGRSCLPTIV